MLPLPLLFAMLALTVVTVFYPPAGLALVVVVGIAIARAAWAKSRARDR